MASSATVPTPNLPRPKAISIRGNYQDAKIFAMRAQQKMKRGAPGWVRAQDIINYKRSSKKK